MNTHIYSVLTKSNYLFFPKLVDILNSFSFTEHRIYVIKNVGRIKEAPVDLQTIISMVRNIRAKNKITIKVHNQPFLFINFKGEVKLRNV